MAKVRPILRLVNILITVLYSVVLSQELRELRYELVIGRRFKENRVLCERTFNRVMLCVMDCKSDSTCTSVAWNRNTGTCQLSRYDISHYQNRYTKMNDDANWLAYARIVYKGKHIQC